MKMKKQLADLGYPPEVVKNFVPKGISFINYCERSLITTQFFLTDL